MTKHEVYLPHQYCLLDFAGSEKQNLIHQSKKFVGTPSATVQSVKKNISWVPGELCSFKLKTMALQSCRREDVPDETIDHAINRNDRNTKD